MHLLLLVNHIKNVDFAAAGASLGCINEKCQTRHLGLHWTHAHPAVGTDSNTLLTLDPGADADTFLDLVLRA